jgi:predicted metalloprotease with PDZ domain
MSDSACRYIFVIEAVDAPDTLVRVLTLVAVQPLDLANVNMVRGDSGCTIRIEADGLDPQRAESLVRRLAGLTVVHSAGLGWAAGSTSPLNDRNSLHHADDCEGFAHIRNPGRRAPSDRCAERNAQAASKPLAQRGGGAQICWTSCALGVSVIARCSFLAAAVCAAALPATSWAAPAQAGPPDDGAIRVSVDATDVVRGVYRIDEVIPAAPGPLTLRLVKWLPGHHAASGRVDAVANLVLSTASGTLPWVRDANDIFAFKVTVPPGQSVVHAHFDFMTPLQPPQGRVSMTPAMLELEWDMATLYPEPQPASAIRVLPEIRLPPGWAFATALTPRGPDSRQPVFAETDLATLIDSPVLAAPSLQVVSLGQIGGAPVRIDLAQDITAPEVMTEARVKTYREMLRQAGLAFGGRAPFTHYDLLLTVSDELGGIGWEHLQSSEVGSSTGLYRDWNKQVEGRLTLPHEFIHAWNGKYRRPEGLRSPAFSEPMNGALLWIYEGLTQYYAVVLSARSGLVSETETRDYLAAKATRLATESGRRWRPLGDTINEPAINPFHTRASWPDWRRNVTDYYDEGILLWLEVDATIRNRTQGRKSLDDFAALFFRSDRPTLAPRFYDLDEVIADLSSVAPYDWAGFFRSRVTSVRSEPPVEGIEAAGWRLTSGPQPGAGLRDAADALDLIDTAGFSVNDKGEALTVRWGSPASEAGLVPGAVILAVNGIPFSRRWLSDVIAADAKTSGPIVLIAKERGQVSTLKLEHHAGLTYPHLQRGPDSADRLSEILAPRTTPDAPPA